MPAWFTPDFRVVTKTGMLEFHETKGQMREAALTRLRVAADLHPYRFVVVHRTCSGWDYTEVTPSC